jgi:hypothetical protein
MAISYKVSPQLKQALAKASALPRKDQDDIAATIMEKIAGDGWVTMGVRNPSVIASIRDLIDTVAPKHPAARAITLTFGSFILFVQAPMVLLMGAMMVVESARIRPGGPMGVRQVAVGGSNQASVTSTPRPVTPPAYDAP